MTVEIDDCYKDDIQEVLDEYGISLKDFTTDAVLNHINACRMRLEHKVTPADEPHTYQFPKNETIGIRNALEYYNIPYKIYKSDVPYLWNIDVYLNEEDFNYIREIHRNHVMTYARAETVDGVRTYYIDE